MQTPKPSGGTKSSSGSESGRRVGSVRSVSSDTVRRSSGRVVRVLKTTGFEPVASTGQPGARTPKTTTSPRVIDRVSPRSHVNELQKNRLARVSELQTQVTQLEDALRTVKDQLIVSESWKKQAKIDAEESRKELLAVTLKLEETQKLLARHDEQDDESEQKSNLNSITKLNSADSSALTAALKEIDQLKVKLNTTSQSEATKAKQAESEIQTLKQNMSEIKNQLQDSKISESKAQSLANETLHQLETAKKNMESFGFNKDAYKALVFELEHTRARVRTLEGIVEEKRKLNQEGGSKSRFHEAECSQTMEMVVELKKSKEVIEELKANLMDKETELQCVVEENEGLSRKMANLIAGVGENESNEAGLKSKVLTLETELREKCDENEKMVLEIKRLNRVVEGSNQDFNGLKSKLTVMSDENEDLKHEIKKVNGELEESKQDFNSLESKLMVLVDENENLKLEIEKVNSALEESKQDFNDDSKLTVLEDENENLKQEIQKVNGALEKSTQDFITLESKLTVLETELYKKSNEYDDLKLEIQKVNRALEESKQDFSEVKSKVTVLETELTQKSHENANLKIEINKTKDATEDVKMGKSELEEELRRLKLQMGQWRKAAEVATAMLCDENDDKNGRMVVERAWSMGHYTPRKKMNIGSPRSVEIDDDDNDDDTDYDHEDEDEDDNEEFLKRRSGNVLKRIGVLWKKPQNK